MPAVFAPFSFVQLLTGLGLALLIAFLAYRAGALDRSGAFAAMGLGTVIFGIGGWGPSILLMAFFVTSSGLSRLFGRRKAALNEKFSKGSRRDAFQVLANGGTAGAIILLTLLFPQVGGLWLAFAAALAAANADTWATELGVLNPHPPRLITSGKPVERGTSGAISLVGTLAALGGSTLIAILAVLLTPRGLATPFGAQILVVALAGLTGSLVDSILGATVQAIYSCPTCQKETERHPLHTCGTSTLLKRGWVWMDNDWVNGLCTISAALLAGVLAWIL
jgi:uncharacterized protein (TIGR00297 family)